MSPEARTAAEMERTAARAARQVAGDARHDARERRSEQRVPRSTDTPTILARLFADIARELFQPGPLEGVLLRMATVATDLVPGCEFASVTVISSQGPVTPVATDAIATDSANTMSGTRFNTKLDDLASSVTVMTKQQMSDFAMLDMNDVFLYVAGTEGTGTFTDFTLDRNGSIGDNVQNNPTQANRVRGIAPANISLGNIETMGRVPVERSTAAAFRAAVETTPAGETLWVVPTYTAMLEVREIIAKRAGTARFWE